MVQDKLMLACHDCAIWKRSLFPPVSQFLPWRMNIFFSFGAAMPPRVINRNACNFDCICKRKVGVRLFLAFFFQRRSFLVEQTQSIDSEWWGFFGGCQNRLWVYTWNDDMPGSRWQSYILNPQANKNVFVCLLKSSRLYFVQGQLSRGCHWNWLREWWLKTQM